MIDYNQHIRVFWSSSGIFTVCLPKIYRISTMIPPFDSVIGNCEMYSCTCNYLGNIQPVIN